MKKTNFTLLLLVIAILLIGMAPVPVAAAESLFTLDWVRNTESEAAATRVSAVDRLTVDNEGNVYVCNTDGYLYVFTPDNSLKWKVNLRNSSPFYDAEMGVGPVLDAAGNCYAASKNGMVYKIDPNGHVLVTLQMAGSVADSTSPVLSADGSTLYVVTGNQNLYALNVSDLSIKWQARTKGYTTAVTPIVSPADGTVIVGAGDAIVAYDSGDGSIKWEKWLPEKHTLSQYYRQGVPNREIRMQVDSAGNIYVMLDVREDASLAYIKLCRLEPPSGPQGKPNFAWEKSIYGGVTGPVLYGNTIYYCTTDKKLHAINIDNGETKWELFVNQGTGFTSMPMVAKNGDIYFNMGVIGKVRDNGDAGELIGTLEIPSNIRTGAGNVSHLGPHGELYTRFGTWLVKIIDNSFQPMPDKIEISPGEANITLAVGGKYVPDVTLRDTNGNVMHKGGLVFSSDSPAVVDVVDGALVAKQAGSAAVTITHPANENLSATINVTVQASLSGCRLNITTHPLEIGIGQTRWLTATLLTADNQEIKGEPLVWSSSNTAVAEVTADGQLRGKQAGTALVRVRLANHPDVTGSATVTVLANVIRQVDLAEINDKINRTVGYYQRRGAPGKDWAAFALNAVGQDISGSPYISDGQTYLDKLEAAVKKPGYFGLMTDYERTAIGVVSAGGDTTNFAGINLLEKIYNFPSLGQGINAAVFGLAALDAANAEIPSNAVHNRESLIKYILENRVQGGWSFGGSAPDPDMTGMALYALAPYRDRPAVKEAGEAAIRWLSTAQNKDGTLGSWGSINSESISQAIMGVTAWGVDPQGPLFTKQDGNLVTGLLGFYFEDSGMFGHNYGSPDPVMATDQGLQALAALKCYMEKGYSDIFYKIVFAGGGPREITAVEISPNGLEIPPGYTVQLKAVDQSGLNIDTNQLKWSTSDAGVASIDEENGTLTAYQPGQVQVTAILQEDQTIRDAVSLEVFGENLVITKAENPVTLFGVNRAVTLEVENKSGKEETAVMIIVLVDKDTGKMVYSSYITEKIAAGKTAELTGAVDIPATGNYQGKVMLWNGWDKLRPLMDSIDL